MTTNSYIPLGECKPRTVYRIWSRNLAYGVYDGDNGFIGIREKFGRHYLFTEYHWDQGPPFGTVKPLEDLGPIPDELELRETVEAGCYVCGEPITYHKELFGQEWPWRHDGRPDLDTDHDGGGSVRTYRPLFDFLETLEAFYEQEAQAAQEQAADESADVASGQNGPEQETGGEQESVQKESE